MDFLLKVFVVSQQVVHVVWGAASVVVGLGQRVEKHVLGVHMEVFQIQVHQALGIGEVVDSRLHGRRRHCERGSVFVPE